jgi:esterase/lipase superfamily enzyme
MYDYVISVREVIDGEFKSEPSKEPTRFLKVSADAERFTPADDIPFEQFRREIAHQALRERDLAVGSTGDILVFVHGYNNSIEDVLQRTRLLRTELDQQGWKGVVIAFDWPSDNHVLNYLEDRVDAANTATKLVTDCLIKLAAVQDPEDEALWGRAKLKVDDRNPREKCEVNIHLLGHSTGAYVIMEAFAQAEKIGNLFQTTWRMGQIAFIGADVSMDSLALNDHYNRPMLKRIMRLTNYQNGFDDVLAVSNAKRFGTKPRAGRAGTPIDVDRKILNVDCSKYFSTLDPKSYRHVGWFTHSWHIAEPTFCLDLALTLEGRIDREYLPTRDKQNGKLVLVPGTRPPFEHAWERDVPRKQ